MKTPYVVLYLCTVNFSHARAHALLYMELAPSSVKVSQRSLTYCTTFR